MGGISLNDPEYKNGDNQPSLEALTIFRHIERITRGEHEPTYSHRVHSYERSYGRGRNCEAVWSPSQTRHGTVSLFCLGREDGHTSHQNALRQ